VIGENDKIYYLVFFPVNFCWLYTITKKFSLSFGIIFHNLPVFQGKELIRRTASKLVDSPRLRKQYICSCLPQHQVVCSIHNLRTHHTVMAGDSKLESQYI
jgi:hypothetical protein